MRNTRVASEDEVILSFLRGELDSSRFGNKTRAALDRAGGAVLATDPDLRSGPDNRARRAALAEARGWGTNDGYFAGFPLTVTWLYAELEAPDLNRIRFIDYSYWTGRFATSCRRCSDARAA